MVDFGELRHDKQFCINGIVWPDHVVFECGVREFFTRTARKSSKINARNQVHLIRLRTNVNPFKHWYCRLVITGEEDEQCASGIENDTITFPGSFDHDVARRDRR